MSEELKPCPFCGRTSAVIIHSGKYVTVTCSFSYGGCGASTACKLTEDEAIEAWNTRADFQQTCIFTYHDDIHCWECSECENAIFFASDSLNSPKDNDYRYCPFCGSKIIKEIRNYE